MMQNGRYKNPLELMEGRHMHPLLRVFKFVAAVLLLIPIVGKPRRSRSHGRQRQSQGALPPGSAWSASRPRIT